MSNSRADILRAARRILAEHSLADLTMRRLATDLGVRPNALYWHFPNKQTMLAALADDILAAVPAQSDLTDPTGPDPTGPDPTGPDPTGTAPAGTEAGGTDSVAELRTLAEGLRNALLAVPDSAEVVSASWASGLAGRGIETMIADTAHTAGLPPRAARGLATAVCQLTIGLTIEEQTRTQMERLGVTGPSGRDFAAEFSDALEVILDAAAAARRTPRGHRS
ncbi:TetR/AcrR family transcriptional regulator [Gordonia shandongensis]|uniref:TetR/AcrR family transcriptional regulator n=1 Tax=Gordonia shandongensis TaxID=376351 RepID=UPI0004179397|nr:helix-turn-helix domain-containing protein [Gordonia shandongensis]